MTYIDLKLHIIYYKIIYDKIAIKNTGADHEGYNIFKMADFYFIL